MDRPITIVLIWGTPKMVPLINPHVKVSLTLNILHDGAYPTLWKWYANIPQKRRICYIKSRAKGRDLGHKGDCSGLLGGIMICVSGLRRRP